MLYALFFTGKRKVDSRKILLLTKYTRTDILKLNVCSCIRIQYME
nr:MAG TPA: hypothetical protein [Caudoviricetes sp.]